MQELWKRKIFTRNTPTIMNQKKIEDINHNINVDTILKCLWAIRDKDQFYFIAYGKEMIEKYITQTTNQNENRRGNDIR